MRPSYQEIVTQLDFASQSSSGEPSLQGLCDSKVLFASGGQLAQKVAHDAGSGSGTGSPASGGADPLDAVSLLHGGLLV